jgi:hypothetical protein
VLGWDPVRLGLLRSRAHDVLLDLTSLSGTVAFLHDVEPVLGDTDVLLRRLVDEWQHDLLPGLYRVLGSTFADAAVRTIDEWRRTAPIEAGLDHRHNPADDLFATMLTDGDDPSAAAAFVLRAADDPSILFDTAADPLVAQGVALLGTAALSAADAERVLSSFIEWFHHYDLTHNPIDESYQRDWRPFLVDLVAPWARCFAPLDTSWRSTPQHRAGLLAIVVDDIASLDRLLARAGGVVREIADGVAHGMPSLAAVELLGSYLGLLGGLAVTARTEYEEARLAVWRRLWIVASMAVSAIVGTYSGGTLVSASADATVTTLQHLSDPFRPHPERVAADTEYAQRVTLVVAADALATALVHQWLLEGTLPIDAAPLPRPEADADDPVTDYLRALAAWRAQLPDGADGDMAMRFAAMVSAVLGPEEAGRATAAVVG